jgi:hypothetical protein
MAKQIRKQKQEFDGIFVLKLVLYVILGSLWLKINKNGSDVQWPLPLGLILGLILTSHEHFRIDRKIEYAVLVITALIGFLAPYGLFISL